MNKRPALFDEWPTPSLGFHLLSAFLLGLGLRVLLAGFTGAASHDAVAYYLPNAKALVDGGMGNWDGMSIAVPPLFPSLIALLSTFVPDLEVAALTISVICGGAIVFPAFALTRHYFPDRVEIQRWSPWIAAVLPMSVRYGGSAKAEACFALLFASALYFGVRAIDDESKRRSRFFGMLFGLFTGLAYLVRPEALGIPIVLTILWLARLWRSRHSPKRVRAELALRLPTAALATLLLAPCLAWNISFVHYKIGVWTLSPKAGLMLRHQQIGENTELGKLDAEGLMTGVEKSYSSAEHFASFAPLQALVANPWGRTLTFVRNAADFTGFLPGSMGTVLFVLFFFGIPLRRGPRHASGARGYTLLGELPKARHGGLWVLLITYSFYIAVLSIFYISRRFWLPLLPLAVPWCALGAVSLQATLARKRWLPAGAFAAVVFLANAPQSLGRAKIWENDWMASPEKTIGKNLLARFGKGKTYVSTRGRVAWYAEGSHKFLPQEKFSTVIEYMRRANIEFLVVDLHELKRRRSALFEDLLIAGWEPIESADGGKRRVRVYRIEPHEKGDR